MTASDSLDLTGLWIPIVTPFTDDGTLDDRSLHHLGETLLADGATGLIALGTTGEPATLNAAERVAVAERCGSICADAGRPLIVGAGTNSTAGTIEEIHRLGERTNPAAALVVVPYYTRPSEEAVVEHFLLVADASPIPIVMYNIPYRTGRGLGSESLRAASAHPNIVGLKQSVGGIDADTLDLLATSAPNLQVLAGDDAFIAPSILMGGVGGIAAAAHLCTELFVDMANAALAGDVARARRHAEAVLPVVTAGFAEPSPAVWKAALKHAGRIESSHVRRPLAPSSADATERLVAAAASALSTFDHR